MPLMRGLITRGPRKFILVSHHSQARWLG